MPTEVPGLWVVVRHAEGPSPMIDHKWCGAQLRAVCDRSGQSLVITSEQPSNDVPFVRGICPHGVAFYIQDMPYNSGRSDG